MEASTRAVTNSRRQALFVTNTRKRIANLLYLDVLAFARLFTDIMPGPIRNWLMRRVFTRSAPGVYFDRHVYVKFPWLVSIGARSSINRGVEFYPDFEGQSRITIGADCYVAPHVRFHAAGHDLDSMTHHVGADITVEDGVWLGAGCIVLPGVTIGSNTVVGAGSVVTHDLPAGVVAAGAPARVLRMSSSGV
jgi:acetyltransferase-like isoleucine patch superfamily enzyme